MRGNAFPAYKQRFSEQQGSCTGFGGTAFLMGEFLRELGAEVVQRLVCGLCFGRDFTDGRRGRSRKREEGEAGKRNAEAGTKKMGNGHEVSGRAGRCDARIREHFRFEDAPGVERSETPPRRRSSGNALAAYSSGFRRETRGPEHGVLARRYFQWQNALKGFAGWRGRKKLLKKYPSSPA